MDQKNKLNGSDSKTKWLSRNAQLDIPEEIRKGASIMDLSKKYEVPYHLMQYWYGRKLEDILNAGRSAATKVCLHHGSVSYYRKEEEIFEGIPDYNYETLSKTEKQIFNKLSNMINITELITDWSKTFNLPIKEKEGFPTADRVDLCVKLIKEEAKETFDAIDANDFQETKDGLGDLLWVTIRAMLELGIDPEKTIQAIYNSNMSKADNNELQAEVTKAHYASKGISTYYVQNQGKFLTYRTEDNKLLKSSVNFKKPSL